MFPKINSKSRWWSSNMNRITQVTNVKYLCLNLNLIWILTDPFELEVCPRSTHIQTPHDCLHTCPMCMGTLLMSSLIMHPLPISSAFYCSSHPFPLRWCRWLLPLAALLPPHAPPTVPPPLPLLLLLLRGLGCTGAEDWS